MSIDAKFMKIGTNDAPGQEGLQCAAHPPPGMRGDLLPGRPVDFSHGDVDAHPPTPSAFELFSAGHEMGAAQAYTEYRGDAGIRQLLAEHLARFTGASVDGDEGTIITPGTQGALFLAVAANVEPGDKVAIVRPDYFANRKLVDFFGGKILPVQLNYLESGTCAGLDLTQLEEAFRAGTKLFLFSNPNNPSGVVYSAAEIAGLAELASRYGATVIVDQLYSRLLYDGAGYTHLRAGAIDSEQVVTIMGPSKTESLSGYRLGVAFGSRAVIARMEKLQAIMCLRAAGYAQAVLRGWFDEPAGWLDDRIRQHQAIRDSLLAVLRGIPGVSVRTPQAGSYLFPKLPKLAVPYADFVRILRLQAGVTVTPGTEFSPDAANSVRINFSQDRATAIAAVERIAALTQRYRA